jgi:hypothetical protein
VPEVNGASTIRLPALPYSVAASSCWSYNMAPRLGGPVGIASAALRELRDDKGKAIFLLPQGWVWSDDPIAVAELRGVPPIVPATSTVTLSVERLREIMRDVANTVNSEDGAAAGAADCGCGSSSGVYDVDTDAIVEQVLRAQLPGVS